MRSAATIKQYTPTIVEASELLSNKHSHIRHINEGIYSQYKGPDKTNSQNDQEK